MAYAAYLDHLVRPRPTLASVFKVLEFTVPTVDSCRVRRAIAQCRGAGVLRCEPLKQSAACTNGTPRARLIIRLPAEEYASVMHCLLACTPDGEIGHLCSWREHLQRCGIGHGG